MVAARAPSRIVYSMCTLVGPEARPDVGVEGDALAGGLGAAQLGEQRRGFLFRRIASVMPEK